MKTQQQQFAHVTPKQSRGRVTHPPCITVKIAAQP